jgi:ATP-binding cassette subfamily B protein RaxB
MQDDTLFAGSIADNIAFFDTRTERAWIEECARLASIHDDIARLPMGYQTLVGDMGTTLSGGQKQRVLLARALYRRPRVLILDEATSHLDIAREADIGRVIAGMPVTRIVVAHRPQTLATVDRVVEMADGRIVRDDKAIDYLKRLAVLTGGRAA